MITDDQMMLRTLKLALKGSGFVSPNPRVGAIITDENGEIIGEGWHKKFGNNHAEIEAIKCAGRDDFTGCTMYVNLEPCSHQGKTPACAPVLVEKNFKRVVIAMQDPNPMVQGSGIEILENAGIEITVGTMENQAKWINRFFIKHIQSGIPYVIIKAGQSLDGCIATKDFESKWITSEESRKNAHSLRAEVDALIVGRNTVIKDNPRLNVRNVNGRDPKKVIFDTYLQLSLELKIFQSDNRTTTIICCSEKAAKTHKAEALKVSGVKVVPVKLIDDEKLDVKDALCKLSTTYNISSVMVEGGGQMLSSFIASDCVDEAHLFVAPIIIGDGIRAFGNCKTDMLDNAKKFKTLSAGKSGKDTHIILVKKN